MKISEKVTDNRLLKLIEVRNEDWGPLSWRAEIFIDKWEKPGSIQISIGNGWETIEVVEAKLAVIQRAIQIAKAESLWKYQQT